MSYVHPAPKDRDLAKQYQTAAKNLIYFEDNLEKELQAKNHLPQDRSLQNERIERFMNDDVPQYKNARNMANKFSTVEQLQRGGIPDLNDKFRHNIGTN